jgi:hypothetical protein
MTSCLYA